MLFHISHLSGLSLRVCLYALGIDLDALFVFSLLFSENSLSVFFFYPLEQKWQDLTINWNKYKIVFIDILVDID